MFMVNVGKYTSPMDPMGVAGRMLGNLSTDLSRRWKVTPNGGEKKGIPTNMALNQVNDLW